MRQRCSLLWILLLVLCVPMIRAQDGLRGALSRSSERIGIRSPFAQELAAADFDNDQRPDGVVLLKAGHWYGENAFRIELHLTSGTNATIRFFTAETKLSISALDVNRDGAPDIVIEKAFTHERVRVYLNNGHGEFRTASEPFAAPDESAPQGHASTRVQYVPTALLPATCRLDLTAAQKTAVVCNPGTRHRSSWPEAQFAACGAHAAIATRAPPSLTSL